MKPNQMQPDTSSSSIKVSIDYILVFLQVSLQWYFKAYTKKSLKID